MKTKSARLSDLLRFIESPCHRQFAEPETRYAQPAESALTQFEEVAMLDLAHQESFAQPPQPQYIDNYLTERGGYTRQNALATERLLRILHDYKTHNPSATIVREGTFSVTHDLKIHVPYPIMAARDERSLVLPQNSRIALTPMLAAFAVAVTRSRNIVTSAAGVQPIATVFGDKWLQRIYDRYLSPDPLPTAGLHCASCKIATCEFKH